jgi:tRNA threonylcarbamoyl adenosine modification protein YjeE
MRRPDLDESELGRVAERLGELLVAGDVVCLRGPMGAGKTTFARALARGLRVDAPDRVCSPSYTLCTTHPGPVPLAHVDLYRLGDADMAPLAAAGVEALGLEHGELSGGVGVVVVEWPELWPDPASERLEVEIFREPDRPDRRTLELRAHGNRGRTLLADLFGVLEKAV